MNGWVIYNSSLRIDKLEMVARRLVEEGLKAGVAMKLIDGSQIITGIDSSGNAFIVNEEFKHLPDFVVFWDKDVSLARHIELMGIRVFNSSLAIGICDDKCLMHQYLCNKGIRVPKTVLSPLLYNSVNVENYIDAVMDYVGEDLVIKDAYGSFGQQVYNCIGKDSIMSKVQELIRLNKRFLIQERIKDSYGKDIRVNVIGGKIIGSMLRTNPSDFRANISSGGQGSVIKLDRIQEEIALNCCSALGLDYCGVDLLFSSDGPVVCEVNSNFNFLSFENLSGYNVAKDIIDYVVGEMQCVEP